MNEQKNVETRTRRGQVVGVKHGDQLEKEAVAGSMSRAIYATRAVVPYSGCLYSETGVAKTTKQITAHHVVGFSVEKQIWTKSAWSVGSTMTSTRQGLEEPTLRRRSTLRPRSTTTSRPRNTSGRVGRRTQLLSLVSGAIVSCFGCNNANRYPQPYATVPITQRRCMSRP